MWTFGRPRPRNRAQQASEAVTAEVAEESGTESFDALLAQIEALALDLYKAGGLPVKAGHYGRSPRARTWKFVGEQLTAEERWDLALTRPGWRFTTLEALGAGSDDALLVRASQLLADCRLLRSNVNRLGSPTTLEAAVRVGSEWRLLEQALSRSANSSKLRFLP